MHAGIMPYESFDDELKVGWCVVEYTRFTKMGTRMCERPEDMTSGLSCCSEPHRALRNAVRGA